MRWLKILGLGGRRWRDGSLLSILDAEHPLWPQKSLPSFLIAINTITITPLVHFCSCAFKHVAIPNIFPLKHSSCQKKTNNVKNLMRIFSMKIIQNVWVKREEWHREKTDSRMKQQAEGHRISLVLHPARSQSRLTTARAKDAQARAKLFSSKQRPPIFPVWPSASLSDSHMAAVVCSFNRKPKKKKKAQDVCTTSFPLSKRGQKNLILADCCWSFFKSPYVFIYLLSNWKLSTEGSLFICLCDRATSSDRCSGVIELHVPDRVWS